MESNIDTTQLENESEREELCFLCQTKHKESELKEVSEGYICKQCIHYRKISKAIVIPVSIVIYFFLHALALYLLYNTYFTFLLLPGPLICFLVIKYSINPVAKRLSVKKYKNNGVFIYNKINNKTPKSSSESTKWD